MSKKGGLSESAYYLGTSIQFFEISAGVLPLDVVITTESITIFGAKGDVERIRIKAIGGRFSSYLADSLAAAQLKYQEQKQRVQEAGGDPGPVTPEVAEISLIMNWKGYNQNVRDEAKLKPEYETFKYKATSADFIGAYLDATLKYAAVAYADRWRKNPLR